jgi:hypothetical protein
MFRRLISPPSSGKNLCLAGSSPTSVTFLFDLLFDPEFGGDILFRNVGVYETQGRLNPED